MMTRDELLRQLYKLDCELSETEQRRRIARRLRASGVETKVWCAPASAQDTLDDIACATGFEDSEAKTVQEHLADLIEPEPERTCHDFGGEKGTNGEQYDFACSACGFMSDILQPNYCPHCGSRIISRDMVSRNDR